MNDTRMAFEGLMILAGIALVITGFNGSRPLVFVGAGLVLLALIGRLAGRKQS